MKKYLLPEKGNFYKANLHCHSTFSDGSLTPEELKEMYVRHGYSIIAFTDHHTLHSQAHLTDKSFLALDGYEIDVAQQEIHSISPFVKFFQTLFCLETKFSFLLFPSQVLF